MKPVTRLAPLALLLSLAVLAGGADAQPRPRNYPTADRVIYVLDCMRQHPGPEFEMLSKCSCTLDRLAARLSFDDFTAMTTATNANSIGGERGNVIRDTEVLQKDVRRFRELQAQAKKACFITSEPQLR